MGNPRGADHLRGGAEDRAQAAQREQEPLLAVLKRELAARGYVEVEPGATPNSGGAWRDPDGDVDRLLPSIRDCLTREACA